MRRAVGGIQLMSFIEAGPEHPQVLHATDSYTIELLVVGPFYITTESTPSLVPAYDFLGESTFASLWLLCERYDMHTICEVRAKRSAVKPLAFHLEHLFLF